MCTQEECALLLALWSVLRLPVGSVSPTAEPKSRVPCLFPVWVVCLLLKVSYWTPLILPYCCLVSLEVWFYLLTMLRSDLTSGLSVLLTMLRPDLASGLVYLLTVLRLSSSLLPSLTWGLSVSLAHCAEAWSHFRSGLLARCAEALLLIAA